MKKLFLVGAVVSVLVYSVAVSAEKSFKQEIKHDATKADAVSAEEMEKRARQEKFDARVQELKSGKKSGNNDPEITGLARDESPLAPPDND